MSVSRKGFLAGCLSCCAAASIAATRSNSRRIVIAHCGDPQFGYDPQLDGERAYRKGLERAEREIARINELAPDCVCFAGDMANDWRQAERDWPRLLRSIRCPWIVTVGNHDIPDARSEEQSRAFVRVFGYDHCALTVCGWRLISLNGQYERDPGHHADYVAWRNAEFAALKDSGCPGIVLTHQPMVLERIDEADTKENYPADVRRDVMDRMADACVRFVLAGHTHRFQARACRGIPILNAETTCNNFDGRPYGFRMLQTDDTLEYSWKFIAV